MYTKYNLVNTTTANIKIQLLYVYWTPGPYSSNLIKTLIKAENSAYVKYNTPISLAFEDKNHLSNHMLIPDVFIVR